jgi:exo-beta-1,3-glucanase (GH17 family)
MTHHNTTNARPSRSASQLARSEAVKIGQLAIAYFMARQAGKRKSASKLEKLIFERLSH